MIEEIKEVAIESIRVSPFQPRRIFSEEELEELSQSIQAVGLIHPPVVRAVKAGEKVLYYELIAGERRWRASKKAGFETLPVLVRTSTDEMAAKATLIENVQRVNLDPMEMALAFKKLMDVFRMTQEEIALKVGKKRSTVANYLRLLVLPKTIKDALSSKEITMGHAKAILALDSDELKQKLHALIVEKKMTVRQAERTSVQLTKKRKQKPRVSSKEPNLGIYEEKLSETFQTKVEITSQGKSGGKLTLTYYSDEDLRHLITRLLQSQSARAQEGITYL